ncbi:GNAT family N-acetyltransferase [Photorhabdus luminescens]|uniref:GNAT family N-acetyltransferase n=1 Tax=Photorhabdus luminescens subsp. sonorensis TaxID=1173677 RepID=A0A5C4RDE1_PHOLU|nr:GNAT family N-acetyltransferase [Photorhabdus luminescens]TNH41955.1 GNAT family N-acetyltransferase [Photorhabdus luminescens subsp. sonorensis]
MIINDITVRKATYEDSTTISDIERQAASLFPEKLLSKALGDQTLPTYEIESGIQKQQLWVAESDQKLVGFALIRRLNQLMLLAEIDVLPKYHGQGIASTLISLIIEQLEQNKETALYLTTFRDFMPSRKLYDKFGFVILQSDDIPDELRKILAEEMAAGLGARIAMKLAINPKIDRK